MLGLLKRFRLENEAKSLRLEHEIAGLRSDLAVQNQTYPLTSGTRGSELSQLLTNGTSYAGPAVNERTAMTVSAVYACVRLIAGAIASMPLPIYQRTKDGREKIDHDLWWMLNEQPNPDMTAAVFREYIVSSKLLYGDGFAVIHRKNPYSPVIDRIEPVNPLYIQVKRIEGRRLYIVYALDGTAEVHEQDDILHFPGIGYDGLRSISPIRYAARQAIGLSLAAEEYSARFFSNGARPDIALEVPGSLAQEQIDLLRDAWANRYGGVSNSHLPAIMSGGMKVHELTMNAVDAALIATRQFQVIDIARIYGVPPFMIGDIDKTSSWGSGVEQMGIGFVKYTLQPHLTRMEQEMNRKFFKTSKNFCEFNTAGLERGDIKSRYEAFRIALGRAGEPAWMTQNEVRRIENQPPVPGGDELNQGNTNNAPAPAPPGG
jgi:HK97 family phage portal protein